MGLDKWSDVTSSMMEESTWPIHDRIMGIQASVLTGLMNPNHPETSLRQRNSVCPADQDCLTLPEMLNTVTRFDLDRTGCESRRRILRPQAADFQPASQSPAGTRGTSDRPDSARRILRCGRSSDFKLSAEQLRSVVRKIEAAQAASADKHDPYTTAHLAQVKERITKALDADYILNPSRSGSPSGGSFRFILENDKSGQIHSGPGCSRRTVTYLCIVLSKALRSAYTSKGFSCSACRNQRTRRVPIHQCCNLSNVGRPESCRRTVHRLLVEEVFSDAVPSPHPVEHSHRSRVAAGTVASAGCCGRMGVATACAADGCV